MKRSPVIPWVLLAVAISAIVWLVVTRPTGQVDVKPQMELYDRLLEKEKEITRLRVDSVQAIANMKLVIDSMADQKIKTIVKRTNEIPRIVNDFDKQQLSRAITDFAKRHGLQANQ